jgi:hypothetical protein
MTTIKATMNTVRTIVPVEAIYTNTEIYYFPFLSPLIVQSCSVATGVCTCIGLLASLYDPT